MTRILTLMLLTSGVALIHATVVCAEECPSATSPEQAHELAGANFAAGQELVDSGDMAGALERFRCSYSLVEHPNTLYNMAECAEELEDLSTALGYFRQYLQRFPDDAGREEVEERVRQLEALLPPPETEPEAEPETEPPGPEIDDDDMRMSVGRIMAWVTLGTGSALTVSSLALIGATLSLHADHQRLADAPPAERDNDELASLQERATSYYTAGWILLGVGGAAILASIFLFVFPDAEVPRTGDLSLTIGAAPLRDGGGFFLSGRF